MKGWLIYSEKEIERNREYIKIYEKNGEQLGIEIELLISEFLEIGVCENEEYILYRGEEVPYPDFAVCRDIYPLLTLQLERMGIKTYNNFEVARICNDKALCIQYLAGKGIDVQESVFVRRGAVPAVKEYPVVTKPVSGRGGKDVLLAKNEQELLENIKNYDEDYLLQPLCKNPGKDLRVFVVGKEIVGAILRSSDRDFRANYCLGGDARVYEFSEKEREIVQRVIACFDFGMVGVDFIFNEKNELIFNEIEDVVGSRTLYAKTDIDIVRKYLEYIKRDIEGRDER